MTTMPKSASVSGRPSVRETARDPAGESVLLVDGEMLFARAVARRLAQAGYRCRTSITLAGVHEQVQRERPDVVLIDLRSPGGEAQQVLAALAAGLAPPELIALCPSTDATAAAKALQAGAAACIRKPAQPDELLAVVQRVLAAAVLIDRLARARVREHLDRSGVALIGHSRVMRVLRDRLAALAPSPSEPGRSPPVVRLHGEPGTGMGTAARFLHRAGSSVDRPFLRIDCLPSAGHCLAAAPRQGVGRRPGPVVCDATTLLDAAEGGTLFLDRIDRLEPDMQAVWLEAIDRWRGRRAGHDTPPVRLLVSSRQPLHDMVVQGRFSAPLHERLSGVDVPVPPLRERGDDVLVLAQHFIDRACHRSDLPPTRLDDECAEWLSRHRWPGNVRELRGLIERAVWCGAPHIGVAEIGRRGDDGGTLLQRSLAGMTLPQAERFLIARALAQTGGNVSGAARELGITRMALRYRLERLRRVEPH